MKFVSIGAAALAAAAFATPALAQAVIEDPGRSSIRTQIVKIWGPAIPTPAALPIAATGGAAARSCTDTITTEGIGVKEK